jgi:glc operon protein GlcG
MPMDFDLALKYVLTAKSLGVEKNLEVSVAVVDAAGHPVIFARGKMEAWHGLYMSAGKARLSAAFRKPTAKLMEQWADRPLYAMSLTTIIPGGVTLNPGGYPIFEDGECIGAFAVGGGPPEADDEIAKKTLETLGGVGERRR